MVFFKRMIIGGILGVLVLSVPAFAEAETQYINDKEKNNEAPYRSDDYRMFASISSDMLNNSTLKGDSEIMGDRGFGFRIPALLRADTPNEQENDVMIAMSHIGNDSADWGNLNIGLRRSFNGGKTWSDLNEILSMPVHDAPQEFDDWGSAFYIDPVPVQADNGDIVMLVDMYPESKGLHAADWLEEGSGYKTIDGEDYLLLYDDDSKVDNGDNHSQGKEYTVREDDWIYDSDDEKTNYYIPPNHSDEYQYQTMGDMYYAVGEPDYMMETPPLIPEDPKDQSGGSNDIYVGNIYLNDDKPNFNGDDPEFVKKRSVGPEKEGERYSKYPDVETDPAPLRAAVTSHLWVTRSSDFGESWSQPVDITSQVKREEDGAFLGAAPGTGIRLDHQKDTDKNGRLIMPVYTTGRGAAIYSDDNGETWERATSKNNEGYINNIDEMQFIEQQDGSIMSFGRQEGKNETPVSISEDGGKTWGEQFYNGLQSVQSQKSVITYPLASDSDEDEMIEYVDGMKTDKQYVISSHPTGETDDASRTNGVAELGEVQEDGDIIWVAERSLKLTPNPYANTQGMENFFAYSSLAVLENGHIGILYEPQPNNYLAYGEFNLEWLNEGANTQHMLNRLADYEDEFMSEEAYHKIKMHLTTIDHYETEEKHRKAVKHLHGLKQLIASQKENDRVTEKAYDDLNVNADYLIEKWS